MTVELDPRVLDCVPYRLAESQTVSDGHIVAERPAPTSRGLRGAWDRLRWLMSHPRIRLDALGSAVWQRIDGETSLAEIAAATAGVFPDRAEQLDERVALFATALEHQGLIELRLPTTSDVTGNGS